MDKKQIDELLTCPICLDRFKQPKQLPCQHTFCLSPCLQGLVEGHRVRCPECRASHRLPPNGVQGFPNNLIVGKLLDVPAQDDSKIKAPCQDCKKNNVEAGCHHCDKILCRYFLKNHSQILSQDLQQTLSRVRIIVPEVSQRISEINQHEGAIKQNTESVKADIKRWRQRCISEIDAQTRKYLNEVDAFVSDELRPFQLEKEELLAITSVINNFCGSAEKEISMLSKNAISPSSLRDHQKEVINLTKQGKDHSKMEKNIVFGKKCQVETQVKFCGNEGQSVVAAISNFSGVQRLPRVTMGSLLSRLTNTSTSSLAQTLERYKGITNAKRVFGKYGSAVGCLKEPWGIAVTQDGNIVVADAGNHRIQIFFSTSGRTLRCFGSKGSGPGQFLFPMGVCVSPSGLIAVADRDNHRIQIFHGNGRFIREFGKHGLGKLSHPLSVAISSDGMIFVGDYTLKLKVYSLSGDFVRFIGPGLKFFRHDYVSGVFITMNCDNKILVLLAYNENIRAFSKNGELMWDKHIGFQYSMGITCDSHGNIIVADSPHGKIQILDKAGNFISCFETNEQTETTDPRGVAVLKNGDIVVSDWLNGQIQIF